MTYSEGFSVGRRTESLKVFSIVSEKAINPVNDNFEEKNMGYLCAVPMGIALFFLFRYFLIKRESLDPSDNSYNFFTNLLVWVAIGSLTLGLVITGEVMKLFPDIDMSRLGWELVCLLEGALVASEILLTILDIRVHEVSLHLSRFGAEV
ncbi:MAG TPA: hypothetical protein VK914_09600 [bacterium]|jgi:hypothetical protein|nr:hypothetical protein [bacterium]